MKVSLPSLKDIKLLKEQRRIKSIDDIILSILENTVSGMVYLSFMVMSHLT